MRDASLTRPGAGCSRRRPNRLGSGLPDELKGVIAWRVDRCVLVTFPSLGRKESFTRLLSRPDFFYEALTAPAHGVELLHPKTAVPSFPFWLSSAGGEAQLLVPDGRLKNAFQSPERSEGLMFLRKSMATDLRLTFAGARDHYNGVRASDLGLPDSVFFSDRPHESGTRLLAESRRRGPKVGHLAIGVGAPGRQPDGWMNPLVVALDLSGDACAAPPPGAAANDPRVVLRRWLAESEILALLPGFGHEEAVRALAWRLLLERGEGPLSGVERMVAGGVGSAAARASGGRLPWAFFGLDALGGDFGLRGHGRTDSTADGEPALEFRWQPPADLAPNARFVASQLVERWGTGQPLRVGGSQGPHEPPLSTCAYRLGGGQRVTVVPAERRVALPLAVAGRTFSVAAGRFEAKRVEALAESLNDFVRFCGDAESAPLSSSGRLSGYFLELLALMDQLRVPLPEGLQRPWMQRLPRDRLACDVPRFLDALARRLVSPRSRVLVELPALGGAELLDFDWCSSVTEGHRALLWGLLRPRPPAQPMRRVVQSMGWWGDWHLSLLDDPADVQIRFVSDGFTLGQSRLGDGRLGPFEGRAEYETIRFSVPL